MKKLLSLLLAALMLASLAVPAAADEVANYDDQVMPLDETIPVQAQVMTDSMKGSIVILHSNDVHGAIDGYAKMALLKEMYTLMGADVLVLDAGDFIQGDPTVSVSQGATAVELMNLVGYDAAAPGNHEFDYGYDNLKKLADAAQFPLLAANVTKDGQSAFDGDARFKLEKSGKTVGVFGLTTPETASKAHPAKIAGVQFDGGETMCRIAQAQVAVMQATGVDYIVCLGHLGIDEESAANGNRSVDLLEKVTGIDVFIDGHSHSTLDDLAQKVGEDHTVNGTLLTSTGTKSASIGAVVIAPDGAITLESWPTETMDGDATVAARVQELKDEIDAVYGAKFAETEVKLEGEKAQVRAGETNLGDLIADAMVWCATKDGELRVPASNVVAITNGGGIRASIEAGDITRKDINTVLPFGNTVAVVYVSGQTLLEVLEASTFCTPEPVGAFPQVHGLQFTVNTAVAYDQGEQYGDTTYYAPASVGRVSIQSVNGKAFDPAATYAVVTNDFLAAGGDTYYALSASDTIVDTGTPLDEALMAYITTQLGGKITAQAYGAHQGRITLSDQPVVDQPVVDQPAADQPTADQSTAQPMWYDAAVKTVTELGIMKGTGNGFEPDATVTRATVFQTLYNMEGAPAQANRMATFPDAQGKWYESAARWAQQMGLSNGTGDGLFDGDREAKRVEIVVILHRYIQSKGVDTSLGDGVNLLAGYADAELLTPYSIEAAQWAVGSGVLAGKVTESGLLFAPGHTATRAELAQILTNITGFFLPAAQ